MPSSDVDRIIDAPDNGGRACPRFPKRDQYLRNPVVPHNLDQVVHNPADPITISVTEDLGQAGEVQDRTLVGGPETDLPVGLQRPGDLGMENRQTGRSALPLTSQPPTYQAFTPFGRGATPRRRAPRLIAAGLLLAAALGRHDEVDRQRSIRAPGTLTRTEYPYAPQGGRLITIPRGV